MKQIDDVKEILFTEDQIKSKVVELGKKINDSYPDPSEDLLLVGVLKGASVFIADLIREIERPINLDFMAVSSYGLGRTESTGVVRILKDLDNDIEGKHVILVEDIVDTGATLAYLSDIMSRRGAKSVKIASLLSKKARRENEVSIDFLGFDIPDEFIVGYGIDYSEKYRNLKFIASLKESVYQTK